MKPRLLPAKHSGLVAILDALGAATFDDAEINRFLAARRRATELLDGKLQEMDGGGKVNKSQVRVFTFNDTVLITLRAAEERPSDSEVIAFILLLRRFFIDSLMSGVLFRGSIALGDFIADNASNTILGPAVSDAAAWYDKADWIGLHLTPKMSLELARRQERSSSGFACLDYNLPLRDGQTRKLKACNWPRLLSVSSIKKQLKGESPREWFLGCLSQQKVPLGTEKKYFNSLTFFDFCSESERAKTQV